MWSWCVDLTPAGCGSRGLGLPRVQIPFHSSLRLAGQGPLLPVTSHQHDSSPCSGERKARVFTEGQRRTEWSVSSLALCLVLPQASLTSFPLLEKGMCAWFDSSCVPYIWAPQSEGDDPFCDLPSSFRVRGPQKNPPASQSQGTRSVTCCWWGKWDSLLHNARIIIV